MNWLQLCVFCTIIMVVRCDWRRDDIVNKVGAMYRNRFNSDAGVMFSRYDADHNGGLASNEIYNVLVDANCDCWACGAWADGVIDQLDRNGDKQLPLSELRAVL
eukprot:TRINITY_DN67323_c5_g6_i1.p1 TRINITY_DN67323_c5_g6~~TRINITY_DN67323_c5_g6_i1.p1  ORF type:complete len:104 (-),score=0.41 TRINITY_DN67323_c5_g6_i1:111-422(-)